MATRFKPTGVQPHGCRTGRVPNDGPDGQDGTAPILMPIGTRTRGRWAWPAAEYGQACFVGAAPYLTLVTSRPYDSRALAMYGSSTASSAPAAWERARRGARTAESSCASLRRRFQLNPTHSRTSGSAVRPLPTRSSGPLRHRPRCASCLAQDHQTLRCPCGSTPLVAA
ncbi:MAG: hypothetical protein ACI835_002838 [Planctomycetota bacterium]|jgi:hypothetical protein